MLERTFDTGRVVRSFDTGKALRQSFGTRKVAANLVSIDRVLERSFDFGKALERSFDTRRLLGPAFDTSKVMATLLSAYRVGPAFDTSKLLGLAFDTGLVRVGREPALASPLMPISPHGPIPVPADPGWLHQLLNDEERFRAVAPYLAFASGGCMLLGLFLVALVDPAVRAALEILDAEASMASLIVALMALLASQRK